MSSQPLSPDAPRDSGVAATSTAEPPSASAAPAPWQRVARYAFVLVPLIALWELFAHLAIVRGVPREGDWQAAREFIVRTRRADDLVASAPWWTDPLARQYFHGLIPLRDAARPDATRYTRALVATIRGGEHPDFRGWTEERAERFGAVTVRVLRNPRPARVLYDFVEHLAPPDAQVFRAERDGERACEFRTGLRVEGGGLGQGALAGRERYQCGEPWNYVGRTVIEDMDHRGRLCIWSHPVVDVPMRTRFTNVPIGSVLRGHHAIAYEAERGGDHGETGPPVTLVVRVGDQVVGRDVHVDGEGWKLFEFDTRALAGTRQDVTFEVTMPAAGNRHYCFEGDTR
jgi:hypothetical protein